MLTCADQVSKTFTPTPSNNLPHAPALLLSVNERLIPSFYPTLTSSVLTINRSGRTIRRTSPRRTLAAPFCSASQKLCTVFVAELTGKRVETVLNMIEWIFASCSAPGLAELLWSRYRKDADNGAFSEAVASIVLDCKVRDWRFVCLDVYDCQGTCIKEEFA